MAMRINDFNKTFAVGYVVVGRTVAGFREAEPKTKLMNFDDRISFTSKYTCTQPEKGGRQGKEENKVLAVMFEMKKFTKCSNTSVPFFRQITSPYLQVLS